MSALNLRPKILAANGVLSLLSLALSFRLKGILKAFVIGTYPPPRNRPEKKSFLKKLLDNRRERKNKSKTDVSYS